LEQQISVDSCGTAAWHVGKAPDLRATEVAHQRGFELGHLRARQFCPLDFDNFDYILAMDHSNLSELEAMKPAHFDNHLGLFLDFATGFDCTEVPDPYYGDGDGFAQVLDMVEDASRGLLAEITHADPA
jgi:protein-tyrosine phosphatase